MNPLSFFMFKKSFHILIITITFTTFMVEALSVGSNFSACVPQNCGNGPNISYPFWIPQLQESYCGFPGFNISCNNNNPVLTISEDDYILKHIFPSNNSFLLVNADVYDENHSCPTPLNNFSIDGTPFSYGPAYAGLYFLYDCSYPNPRATYQVSCASNATQYSFAVFHIEVLRKWNYSVESCRGMVNAPVDGESLDILLQMNYTDILRRGFVLGWNGINCSNCERSGGRCGSLNNEFICFCHDQPHLSTCDAGETWNLKLKLGIGFGAAGLGILIVGIPFFLYHRRNKKRYGGSYFMSRNISSHPSSITDLEKVGTYLGVHIFSYEELEQATNKFDSNKELGDGGFGTVYKGKLRDGRVVAVKRLYENNYKRIGQFMNEVEILARLRHQNLVSLYGSTTHHCRELLLVYEYVPNGTVADHLHGELAKPGSLTWATRMSIAIETASALVYLHASDVIHRDVKTNNILLDNNFGVKVADFGLSRLFPTNVTHVSTAPQGTPGYVDPEYHQCYQLTNKSDVFSFGVVLIELISSKPAVDITRHRHEINLSNMAINKIQNHALHELVDPCLGFETDYKVRKMVRAVAELAFQCLQNGREIRPSMEEVLEELKGIQGKDYNIDKEEEVGVPADDVGLLKNNPQTLSPDTVSVKWLSTSTTSSSSIG